MTSGVSFTAFVLVVGLVYHSLPRRRQLAWLLFASYAFYVACAARFLPVLLLSTLVTAAVAPRVIKAHPYRRAWLWAGVLYHLASLAALRLILGMTPFATPFAAMGAAFYTLQALSLLFDVAAGTVAPPGLARVALYLAYFPKIIAGPIERAHVFLPRLEQRDVVTDRTLARAAWLVAIGLTRKLAIAEPLSALIPAEAFAAPAQLGSAELAGALVAYAFVIYNDFAAYTDMARGVSALFGVELSVNFAQPFFARSFTDFWNRWHISLTHWLRDYIYFPLSRSLLRRDPRRWNLPNLVLPPMAAMVASGVWHGSGLHMVVWGALHGGFLTVERLANLLRPMSRQSRGHVLGTGLVFVLAGLALVSFRLRMDLAITFWERLLRGTPGSLPDPRLLPYLLASLWIDAMEQRYGECPFAHWPRLWRAALLAAAIVVCFLASRGSAAAPFVYQGF